MTLLAKVPVPSFVRHTVSRLSSKDSGAETGGMGSVNNRQNVKWVEGVRGVASFFVVVTHLCRAWNYDLWFPRNTEDAAPQFLQLPWIRLPWQGRIGVTMFAFLTGYVCAIKPLRQAKSGNIPGALTTLGKSAFRRPPRLIMPATIAMFLAWCVTQIGGFDIANKADSGWLRKSSPKTNGGLDVEVPRLFQNFQTSWTFGRQEYDEHQWALLPLLQGAFLIYVLLFATIFMKFRMRVFTCFVLFCWYWWRNSPEKETFECQFLWGVILCDVGSDKGFRDMLARHQKIRRTVMITLLVLGCYVGGYPGERADWATWSSQLTSIGNWIFPPGAHSYAKRWTAIGWDLMATGIWLSPTLQGIFSNKLFMWLGRNSFAVYLTHGTLLRVVLVRMIYGFSSASFSVEKNDKDEPIYHWIPRSQNWFVWAFSIPVFFAILYTVAHLWTTYIDAWCARATKWLEDTMFEQEEDEKQGVAQMA